MTVQAIPRATWGAQPWAKPPIAVAASKRTHFLVHYDGGTPVARTGYAIPRAIDAEHHAKGWNGIGYNHVVSLAGEVFEGRGWGLIGAHCEGFNTASFGVQIAIGGDQVPSPAALHAVRELYDEACSRAGKQLVESWHGAHYPTECPGERLIAWARAGMTDPIQPKGVPVAAPKFTAVDLAPVWAVSWNGEKAEARLEAAASGTALLPVLSHLVDVVTTQSRQITTLSGQVTQLQATVAALTPKL